MSRTKSKCFKAAIDQAAIVRLNLILISNEPSAAKFTTKKDTTLHQGRTIQML